MICFDTIKSNGSAIYQLYQSVGKMQRILKTQLHFSVIQAFHVAG